MSFSDFGAVVSLVTLVVTWCIIQPLKQSLNSLAKAIDNLVNKLDKTGEDVNELRERIAKLETCVKLLTKRLDDLKKG